VTTTWEELGAQLPVDLGRSEPVLVTQEMVDVHADTTGDAQWIHNDPDRARRESPFGGPVVQGFLLMSLFTRLSAGLTFPEFGPVSMLVNYGFDRVRFVRAVPVDSEVWMGATLAQVRPRDDGSAVLSVDVELCSGDPEDERERRGGPPVAVARWLFLAVPRHDSPTNENS
jgi:acyl dehydratase